MHPPLKSIAEYWRKLDYVRVLDTLNAQHHGFEGPYNKNKERRFLTLLTPRLDVVLIQEHKLRCRNLENL